MSEADAELVNQRVVDSLPAMPFSCSSQLDRGKVALLLEVPAGRYRPISRLQLEIDVEHGECAFNLPLPAESALLAPIVPEERERLRPVSAAFSEEDLLRIFDVLTRVEGELRQSTDPRVTLELALLKLTQMRRLVPFAELVARVERLAAGAAPEDGPPSGRVRLPDAGGAPEVRRTSAPVLPVVSPAATATRTTTAPRAGAAPEHARAENESEAALDAQAVLADLRAACQTRPTLAMPLRGAQAAFDAGTLVLRVAAEFASMVEGHLDELTEIARKTTGRALKLRLARPEQAPPGAHVPTATEERNARLMSVASDDPAVRDALDLFNGKVVAVRAFDNE